MNVLVYKAPPELETTIRAALRKESGSGSNSFSVLVIFDKHDVDPGIGLLVRPGLDRGFS
jgi:hypothetical protein